MRNLKIICIFFCLLSVTSAITHIHAFRWSLHAAPGAPVTTATVVTKRSGFGATFLSLVGALFYAVAAYGIHRRAPIAWKLGWGVLGIASLSFLIQTLSFSLKLPQPDLWIASLAILVGDTAITVYWGFWWKRQKSYFNLAHARTSS
jgi:hypothetical protein